MPPATDTRYDCTWEQHGAVVVLTSRGNMRGAAAIDRYLEVAREAVSQPDVLALVSDLRHVTRLPTMSDALRFAREASAIPGGSRVRRSAVVAADGHPLVSVLLRALSSASPFFPDRRVFANDPDGALAWAQAVRRE